MRFIIYALLFCRFSSLFANPIILENDKPGTPGWYLKNPAKSHEIEGFASRTSINIGQSIDIFVNTSSENYSWELFRLGYYNGVGARRILDASIRKMDNQPACTRDSSTQLIDCLWKKSFSLQTSVRWVSGVYVIRLTELSTQKDSFILFVLRDDTRSSEIVYAQSINTDSAYSRWGGHDLYNGGVKVSFNRPMLPPDFAEDQSAVGTGKFFAYYEYNLVRWLEKQGYDTKYITNVDVHEDFTRFASSRIYISAGHDEYWSNQMRYNLSSFRGLGKSILFLSSNTMYWQIRFEPDATGNPNRVIVCYRDANADPVLDPEKKTIRFRDIPLSAPEDEMIGTLYDGDYPRDKDITIRDASHWIFEGTGLQDGGIIPRVLGYEADQMRWDAPESTQRLAVSNFVGDHGTLTPTDMTLYHTEKGGLVFAPGSMQWIWGLDDYRISDNTSRGIGNQIVQTITRNIIHRILNLPCSIRPYPKSKTLLNLRFGDPVGSKHFKDSSAYDRSVICIEPNCPNIIQGINNSAPFLDFTSPNQYLDLGIEPSIRGKTGFSIAFSIKIEPDSNEYIVLQQRDDRYMIYTEMRGYDGSFQVSVDANGFLGFWTYSLQNEHALWMKSNRTIKDGNWHHIVLSRLHSGAGVISIDNEEDRFFQFDRIDELKPHSMFLGHDAFVPIGFVGKLGYLTIWTH